MTAVLIGRGDQAIGIQIERPCKDTWRRQISTNHGEALGETKPVTPRSQTSGNQNCVKSIAVV